MASARGSYGRGSRTDAHPVLGLLIFWIGTALGALAGVGLTYLLTSLGAVSPGNVLAGGAMGFGGSAAGAILTALVLLRMDRHG